MSQNTNTTERKTNGAEPVATDSAGAPSESPESTARSTSIDDDPESSTADSEPERPSSEGDADEQTHAGDLSLDHVFGILKNQRRRRVLRFLYETDGQTSLSEAAEQIAALENDKSVKQITSAERKRVYVGLYQCHLPKMDSMGIVSFNKPRGTLELGDHAPEVYDYIDTDDGEADPQ